MSAEDEDEADEMVRLRRAYNIACLNIVELNDQRAALTGALSSALNLVDHLLTEMRLANLTPSSGAIVTKAKLDQAMRKLLNDEPKDGADPD